MAQPIQTFSISAPGFCGLNTQDSPLDLASGFALVATNCVIDQYGRIGSRKGYTRLNSSTGNLGANDVGVMHELVQTDGTLTVYDRALKIEESLKFSIKGGHFGKPENKNTHLYSQSLKAIKDIDNETIFCQKLNLGDLVLKNHIGDLKKIKSSIESYLEIFVG